MVGVVVVHPHPVDDSFGLESPPRTGEDREACGELGERHVESEPDRRRGSRVECVVPTRHPQHDLTKPTSIRDDVERRAGARELEVDDSHVSVGSFAIRPDVDALPVRAKRASCIAPGSSAHTTRNPSLAIAPRKTLERLVDLGEARVVVQVVGLDVRHDRRERRQQQERLVALVGLGDE